jgi:hypothetical protein
LTVKTGTKEAEPYVPAVTPLFVISNVPVPLVYVRPVPPTNIPLTFDESISNTPVEDVYVRPLFPVRLSLDILMMSAESTCRLPTCKSVSVTVPALKLPDASRVTIAEPVLFAVAVVAELLTLPAVEIVASFVSAIAALALISSLTIEPAVIAALSVTSLVPSNDTAEAVMSPLIEKF